MRLELYGSSDAVVPGNLQAMTIKAWLENAIQDADRRGPSSLRSSLELLAKSTSALRTADWNADASGELDRRKDADGR